MSNLAVEMIRNRRNELLAELQEIQDRYGKEIADMNRSLVLLTGKSIPEIEEDFKYDDENPSYIKNTEDGI